MGAISFAFSMYAQQLNIVWDKTIGSDLDDNFTSMVVMPNGESYLFGHSISGISDEKTHTRTGGHFDYWLVKLNSAGAKVWDKVYGAYYAHCISNSIILTPDNHLILTGHTKAGSGSFNKTEDSYGEDDYWILKVDLDGNVIWDKTLGGAGDDINPFVAVLPNNDIIIAGTSNSDKSGLKSENSKGNYDFWIVKLDKNANVIWDKTIGGNLDDKLTSVSLAHDGNIILFGESQSGKTGDKSQAGFGEKDYWVVKISSSNGSKIWDKTYGGTLQDFPSSSLVSNDGKIYIGGTSGSSKGGNKTVGQIGSNDYWVIKLNQNGVKEWENNFGGIDHDNMSSMILTTNNELILAGVSNSGISYDKTEENIGNYGSYWIIKVDVNGDKMWDKTIGAEEMTYIKQPIIVGADESYGIYIAGNSTADKSGDKTENGRGDMDYWAIKLQESCPQSLNLSGNMVGAIYKAEKTITSEAKVGNPTHYQAGKSITLGTGFLADSGKVFTAMIGGCLD